MSSTRCRRLWRKKKAAEEKKQAQQDSKQASKDKYTAARILAKVAPTIILLESACNSPLFSNGLKAV